MSTNDFIVETVQINGMKMYKVENQLFLKITDARRQANSKRNEDCRNLIFANDFRTKPANYDALSFGLSEMSDDDFLRMLKDGKIGGMFL